MATFNLSDLLKATPLATWKSNLVSAAASLGLKTENWAEGGYTRTLVALFAQLYQTLGDVVRVIAAGGFLDTAEGDWLTLLAKNVFDVDRIEATFAAAAEALTLTNTGGGLFVFEAGDIVVAHEDTGKTYRNKSGGTLSPGVGQTLNLDLEAEEAGTASNAAIGKITVLVTTFIGVTCTNEVALAGLDAEKDPDLRQRCRDSLARLGVGGVRKVYEFLAKSAIREDGSAIGVTRVKVMPAAGDGTVDIFLAGASGALDGDDVDTVQAIFDEEGTPYGFTATAFNSVNHSISVPCTIWIPSSLGLSESDARQAVHDALAAYVRSLPIGGIVISPATGKVFWRSLLGIIEGSIPGMLKGQLTSEADIDIDVGEVPVWSGVPSDTTVMQVST